MQIRTLASTTLDGRVLTRGVIMDFSGRLAGICQMKETIDDIMREPEQIIIKRASSKLERQDHDVFGHETVTLYLEGVPKILAMVLNNEKYYNTSEKSARYTEMETSGEEEELYHKWKEIFMSEISLRYGDMDSKMMAKLALENARYLISVFTPSTNMAYTTSIRQLNYIAGWMQSFIEATSSSKNASKFEKRLAGVFAEFVRKIDKDLLIPGLTDPKKRGFSLFGEREHEEEWGENYSISYYGSFAQLAQAQSHKAINYEFMFANFEGTLKDNPGFYIPPIIYNGRYEKEWLSDAEKVITDYPQGMMLKINERGTCEEFVLKCLDRLCGQAQLEICAQTASTLSQYYWGTKNEKVKEYLEPYVNSPRCKNYSELCKRQCYWGAKQVFTRLV